MKKNLKSLVMLLPLMLSACDNSSVQETLGINREAPDEFSVVSRPPLSLPPEFTLRPPRAGEAPRDTATDVKARELITGKPASVLPNPNKLETPATATAVTPVLGSDALSTGAQSLLKRAGAAGAHDDIRSQLGADAATPADTSTAKTLLDQISGAEKNEPTVDAKKEAERLRANKDEGKPMTEGEVPVEKSGTRSLIDRIF